jgi:hypothetical protein
MHLIEFYTLQRSRNEPNQEFLAIRVFWISIRRHNLRGVLHRWLGYLVYNSWSLKPSPQVKPNTCSQIILY